MARFFPGSFCFLVLISPISSQITDGYGLLKPEELGSLKTQINEYRERSGSVIAINIHKKDAKINQKALVMGLKSMIRPEKPAKLTVLDLEITHFESSGSTYVHSYAHTDWLGQEQQLIERDDHYYWRTPRDKNLIEYRVELKVLFPHFRQGLYYEGLSSAIAYIERLQQGEIKSSDISLSIFARPTLNFWLILLSVLFGLALLAYLLRNSNYRPAKIASNSITMQPARSNDDDDDGDYSSSDSSGFSGGSSGGGGASGSF